MPPAKKPTYLRCKSGYALAGNVVVRGGAILAADDPRVKGREHLFEPVDHVVERATRAPGEMRVVGRPSKAKSDGAE